MRESTAFRNQEQYQTLEQPQPSVVKATEVITRKVPISPMEVISIIGVAIVTMILTVSLVTLRASMTTSQNKLNKINTEASQTTTNNVNLQQEISELTSYDKLSAFAAEHNLKMSNENVRNVSK
ncbi:cell division protein FtsL [Companilactobacillus metriopterae]|uniref:cell division protein FtsL n=1 Tax=Companilactobacillus metriopterae TaxID=1909267 RepID=UPI00100B2484|nr:cell division protein FtsL [Companilactobacillus metriopterae]